MNPWPGLLRDLQSELRRWAQDVDGRSILPNALLVRLPMRDYGRFRPVLRPVTREIGEALVRWAREEGHDWATGEGPFLEVALVDLPVPEISTSVREQGRPPEIGADCAPDPAPPAGEVGRRPVDR